MKRPHDCDGMGTIPSVYSGTVFDVKGVFHTGPTNNVELLLLIDIPLSVAADTMILPYTIYRQIRYGSICPKKNVVPAPPNQSMDPGARRTDGASLKR
jgi:uncharacterized protein YceK